jgi:hypothetical protein
MQLGTAGAAGLGVGDARVLFFFGLEGVVRGESPVALRNLPVVARELPVALRNSPVVASELSVAGAPAGVFSRAGGILARTQGALACRPDVCVRKRGNRARSAGVFLHNTDKLA